MAYQAFVTDAANNRICTAIYKTCISYTEGEISGIMWRGVICAHKPNFLMPGHNVPTKQIVIPYTYVATSI